MKLSIVICVYNTDKAYLYECISSIFSSTLSDYEIVLIDDGSTLDYSDIIKEYKLKYILPHVFTESRCRRANI